MINGTMMTMIEKDILIDKTPIVEATKIETGRDTGHHPNTIQAEVEADLHSAQGEFNQAKRSCSMIYHMT